MYILSFFSASDENTEHTVESERLSENRHNKKNGSWLTKTVQ